jgi:hypothetical protein
MDRTERFYKISEMLRATKVVSFATLLGKLEVSRSTLRRDLNYLSTRLNNPIIHCRELGGYRLQAADASGQRPHELPGLWFSPTEIHALLTMQQLVAGLDAITQVIPLEKAAPEVSDAKLSTTFGPATVFFQAEPCVGHACASPTSALAGWPASNGIRSRRGSCKPTAAICCASPTPTTAS